MTPDVGDFRLFSRRAVLAIRSLREQHRYMRGMVAWLGLKEVMLPFDRKARAAGETNYPILKMLRFAWTGVTSFSAFPLRISIAAGCILSAAGFLYLLRVMYLALWTNTLVPGWASVVALQCIFSGMILLALGAIGDYVARSYEEAKERPLYVVTEVRNVSMAEKCFATRRHPGRFGSAVWPVRGRRYGTRRSYLRRLAVVSAARWRTSVIGFLHIGGMEQLWN